MRKTVLLFLLVLPGISHAVEEVDSMKCKNGTVKAGSSKSSLVESCGEPSSRNTTPDQPLSMGKAAFKATEEWAYRYGYNDYVVMINGDLVVKLFKERRRQ